MDVDPIDGADRDQLLNSRIIQAIDHYKNTDPDAFGPSLQASRLEPIILLQIMLSTYLPAITKAPDRARCIEYVDNNPGLWPKLTSAYSRKSFSELFNYVDMPFLMDLTNQEVASSPSPIIQNLQVAFEEPYKGETPQLFINVLNEYWGSRAGLPAERPYNWSISVIQSSGMGKSRMVEEAASSMFTIPINLHEELGNDHKAYPPPDRMFRDYFRGHEAKSDLCLQAEYAIILHLLFAKVAELVGGWRASLGDRAPTTNAELAMLWAEVLNYGRNDTEVGECRKHILDGVADQAAKSRSNVGAGENLGFWIAQLKQSCQNFVQAIHGNTEPSELICIVYFDEAQQLTQSVPQSEARRRSPYHNLGKVLADLTDFPIFFVFLSTSSHFQKFAPSRVIHPSSRISQGLRLFPPFTELPFDIFVDEAFQSLESQNKNRSLENMGRTDVMAGFGRGLWYVHHKNWAQKQGLPVISFARDKLIAEGNQARVFHSLIAALGVRIGITFDNTTQASISMESELIESHMRVVYAIPEHREFLHGGSPSEPILAEAAARHLNYPPDRPGIEQRGPEILAWACKKGLLAKGERGELCGRLLVTIAHDIALKPLQATDKYSSNPHFHRPVPVLDFLKALFTGDIFHDVILDAHAVTDKADVPTLGTAFAESYIFFSHFALAGDSEMLSAPNLAVALLRGMALQAKDNQESIDAVIPVHMGPLDAPISPKSTSAINLQFKNRKKSQSFHVLRHITVPDREMSVISIIFELGDEKVRDEDELVSIYQATYRETRGSEDKPHWDDHHYEIVAHGCTAKTFRAVLPTAEPFYQSILAAQTIIMDFPRALNQQSLHALQNLKPFFNGVQESKSWAKYFVE
ncbi:uncharacterized protein EI90DRAFT_3114456 [Cantharellus anzutake]|uniref:uncharacterized protein n=1 Tax=Cantharellus anzutake TaxID=1750568 RepID=UPI00190556BE|nr:uncharacterized protein EI90DRAFT_3114456 [Cantharellus anzutake]KAF8343858.1 hypothetical protein EI90DRAFT_3114456 [Cantharellus anzutake]